MSKEDTTRLINDVDDAEMVDLGASSELTEGGIGQPGEENTSSNALAGF